MGYYVEYDCSGITFPKNKGDEVLAAINALHEPTLMKSQASGGSWNAGKQVDVWYGFTQNPPEGGFTSLINAFRAWRFDLDETHSEEYSFGWLGEKIGDEEIFFKALAPYATGEIYARGEDGKEWGFRLKDGTLRDLKCVREWIEHGP